MRLIRHSVTVLAVGALTVCFAPIRAVLSAPLEAPVTAGESGASEEIARMSDEKLRVAIEAFVAEFYLSGEELSADEMTTIYAPTVDYFGSRSKKRVSIIRDQRGYYRRWPERNFELVPGTLKIVRGADNSSMVDVSFEYYFETRSRKRESRGRGIAELTLDFSLPGGRIVREGGKVLERFRRR